MRMRASHNTFLQQQQGPRRNSPDSTRLLQPPNTCNIGHQRDYHHQQHHTPKQQPGVLGDSQDSKRLLQPKTTYNLGYHHGYQQDYHHQRD